MADAENRAAKKNSDLPVRLASAIVMLAIAGTALWLGGWLWIAFVIAIAIGVLWEWQRLTVGFASTSRQRVGWLLSGIAYLSVASIMLVFFRAEFEGAGRVLLIVGAVICTDVGAYFSGRTIGGPKIAPSISPSKTWAGLLGGMLGASLFVALFPKIWEGGLCGAFYPLPELPPGVAQFDGPCSGIIRFTPNEYAHLWAVLVGSVIAIVAQSGDFFESWMKRRAGMKDSSNLIPGHGGLFDRVDGLLAVCFVAGVIGLLTGNFR